MAAICAFETFEATSRFDVRAITEPHDNSYPHICRLDGGA